VLNVYCKGHACPSETNLEPGAQSSCNISADDLYYSLEVECYNESVSFLPLSTYVFNKQPARIYANETFDGKLEETRSFMFYINLVPQAEYHWTIDVDNKVDLTLRGWSDVSKVHVFYEAEDIDHHGSGTFVATQTGTNTYFEITSSKRTSGTFRLVISWPRWNVTSVKPVAVCRTYPCEYVFSDNPKTADTDLWIVTVNEGKSDNYIVFSHRWYNLAVFLSVGLVLLIVVTGIFVAALALFSIAT